MTLAATQLTPDAYSLADGNSERGSSDSRFLSLATEIKRDKELRANWLRNDEKDASHGPMQAAADGLKERQVHSR